MYNKLNSILGTCNTGKGCLTSCDSMEDGYYQYCNDCEVIIIYID